MSKTLAELLRSSVRPGLAWLIGGVFAYLAISGKLDCQAVMGTVSAVVTFYFVQRANEKKP